MHIMMVRTFVIALVFAIAFVCVCPHSSFVEADANLASSSSSSSSTRSSESSGNDNHRRLSDEAKKPHIVLCVVDDIGYLDQDFMNIKSDMKPDISTPNMKKIADQGIRLSHFYVQPVCSPTRSSLMTGRFPFNTGMQHITTIMPGSSAHVPVNVPFLPELLQTVGYETHHVGKWHLGMAKWDYTPTRRGFSTSFGFFQAQMNYFNKTITADFLPGIVPAVEGVDFWENEQAVKDTEGSYSVDLYNQQVKKVIEQYTTKYPEEGQGQSARGEHPLFLYMAHQTVHVPLLARNPNEKRCSHIKNNLRKVYCSMIVELDDSVSYMYELLKSHNLWDDTLFLLTTDNGGMVGYQRDSNGDPLWPASAGSNWPLRGSKATMFEGGMRVAAFISGGSNVIPSNYRGSINSEVLHAVDFPALAVRAAALGSGSSDSSNKLQSSSSSYNYLSSKLQEMDGTYGLMDRLHNARVLEKQSRKNLDSVNNVNGVDSELELVDVGVSGHHVLPLNLIKGGKSFSAIRFGDWKLIIGATMPEPGMDGYWPTNADNRAAPPSDEGKVGGGIFGGPRKMLFNITADPEEVHDVAKYHRNVVREGLLLVKKIVNSHTYREPCANVPHLVALPMFHNGTWAPFQGKRSGSASNTGSSFSSFKTSFDELTSLS